MSTPKRSWLPVKFSSRAKNRETRETPKPEPRETETGKQDRSSWSGNAPLNILLELPGEDGTRRVHVGGSLHSKDEGGLRGHFVCSHKYRVKATTVYLCPPGVQEPPVPEKGLAGHSVDAREFDIEAETVYLCSKEMAELLAKANAKKSWGEPYHRDKRDYRYP